VTYSLENAERNVYFKQASLQAFGKITKLIFDFDGVLVQTYTSYPQTIIAVVDYYFLEILGLEGEKGTLVTLDDVQKFKDTGLFNNDWTLTNAIITYYLTMLTRSLPARILQDFTKQLEDLHFTTLHPFLQQLRDVGDFIKGCRIDTNELVDLKNDGTLGLDALLKANIPRRIRTFPLIPPLAGVNELIPIRRLIPYDLKKPDLLKRLFEESYLGDELFSRFYGMSSLFKFDDSFLEKEKFIPRRETLDLLRQKFGKFQIYSEKPRAQGVYLLEKYDFKEYFNIREAIFLENLTEIAGGDEGVSLGKPNPAPFAELIDQHVDWRGVVAYVGDSIADVLLIENARLSGLSNVLFIGVLCSSQNPNSLLSLYMDYKADAIVTDVNDIPALLDFSLGDF
jgi:phosphoglycolate phosphatase-like HAD superfamily hydrolase